MGVIGKDFKFKVVKNFLSKDEIDLANIYCEMTHRTNQTHYSISIFSKVVTNPDTSYYGDKLAESFLLKKKPLVEKKVGKKILPTYSFWRMYTKFSALKKHTDREACEISLSVNIGSDGTSWPIYIDGSEVNLKPGDAVIYLGCDSYHWRKEFTGDWYASFFLHYVDANGPNKEWEKDKRPYWGVTR
jgi:hypothetical protein|tara:strand:- start:1094 stop:1654 length:561 start_codon:yes stop_codon:yes gene_type:complete